MKHHGHHMDAAFVHTHVYQVEPEHGAHMTHESHQSHTTGSLRVVRELHPSEYHTAKEYHHKVRSAIEHYSDRS